MNWLRTRFAPKEERVFLEAARKVFDDVCSSDTSAAEVYRDHPNVKERHWKEIGAELRQLISSGEGPVLTKRLRGKFAEVVELLVTDHFYTNLETHDREIFSRQILESSRQQQDQIYYFSLARDYTYATILEFIIFQGWDGSEESKSRLKEFQKGFMDECKAHCALVLAIARAKNEGREITHAEKESGKTTVTLKEGMRRALAGEEIFDK